MENLLVSVCIIFTVFLFHASGGLANKIQPELLSLLGKGERPNIFIFFKDGIKPALEKAASLRHIAERGPRNEAIINTLEKHADASQAGVLQTLTSQRSGDANQGFKYFKQYKSANMMFVEEATSDVIHSIARDPNVAKIEKEPMFKLVQPKEDVKKKVNSDVRALPEKPDFNLLQMQVPEAWEELGDAKRDHVVMGFIDTGVRYTHKALIDTFVGSNYGWYDPINKTSEPYEADTGRGHGTCTTSIGIGSHWYIGVAPGIKWMSCLGCNLVDCAAKWLMDCIEFMECPTLPDGTQRNCSKAPHVVSNSWTSVRGETGYNNFILRWRALGITPVFAVGNDGDACASTSAPGEMPFVIGVGGSDDENIRYDGTGIGPAFDGNIKPDILAPTFVNCAGRYSDDGHNFLGGTSAATPHVSGVVALLKVRDPGITYDEIYNLLIQNTDKNLTTPRYRDTCTEPADEYPNNFYGYGRVNALKVLKAQTKMLAKRSKKR